MNYPCRALAFVVAFLLATPTFPGPAPMNRSGPYARSPNFQDQALSTKPWIAQPRQRMRTFVVFLRGHGYLPSPSRPRSGKLILFRGPSATGKSTLLRELLRRDPQLHLQRMMTTRARGSSEKEGEEYFFVTAERFEELSREKIFIQTTFYAGQSYGVPAEELLTALANGKDVLLIWSALDPTDGLEAGLGRKRIREIFIDAPMEEIERRIRLRGRDDETQIRRRLELARQELTLKRNFQNVVINMDVQEARDQILSFISELSLFRAQFYRRYGAGLETLVFRTGIWFLTLVLVSHIFNIKSLDSSLNVVDLLGLCVIGFAGWWVSKEIFIFAHRLSAFFGFRHPLPREWVYTPGRMPNTYRGVYSSQVVLERALRQLDRVQIPFFILGWLVLALVFQWSPWPTYIVASLLPVFFHYVNDWIAQWHEVHPGAPLPRFLRGIDTLAKIIFKANLGHVELSLLNDPKPPTSILASS